MKNDVFELNFTILFLDLDKYINDQVIYLFLHKYNFDHRDLLLLEYFELV
jgi:hypothetical protein